MMVIGGVDNDGALAQEMVQYPAKRDCSAMLTREQCSTAPWVQLNAPAVDIMVAHLNGQYSPESGTSWCQSSNASSLDRIPYLTLNAASPQVAGLANYRSALGNYETVQGTWEDRVTALRRELMLLAYPRVAGNFYDYPLSIWNGVTTVNGHCGTYRGPIPKRDVSSDECSDASTPNSITTSATTSVAVAQTQTTPSSSPSASTSTSTSAANIFTNVTVAPSSIMLGYNSTALLTTIASQLKQQCLTTNTTCNEYSTIEVICSYIPGLQQVARGTLTIKIPESLYQTAAQLAGMITLAVKAMSNSGSNCATYEYEITGFPRRREIVPAGACQYGHVEVCH